MVQLEFVVSLIVLAILGIFDSGYLIKKRVKKQPLSCPINGGCEKVVESRWNAIFFIKNDVLGLFYYILILFLALYLFFALVLVFIQAKIIREYCFYCLISALINLLIFVNVFVL